MLKAPFNHIVFGVLVNCEKGYGDVQWKRPSFQAPSAAQKKKKKKPFSAFFSSLRFPCPSITKFPNFLFKIHNLVNFLLLNLKIWPKPSSESFTWVSFGPKISSESNMFVKKKKKKMISSASPQIWCQSVLQALIFDPSGIACLLQ